MPSSLFWSSVIVGSRFESLHSICVSHVLYVEGLVCFELVEMRLSQAIVAGMPCTPCD